MLDTVEEAIALVNKAEENLASARMVLVRHDINAIRSEPYQQLQVASLHIQTFHKLLKKEK